MTPKGHSVIRDHHDLHDSKGPSDPYVRFDLVYDPKTSQGP